MNLPKFYFTSVFAVFLCTSVFAYEPDVDSAWIASQNNGDTNLDDGTNAPNPDCIGDGCGNTVEYAAPANQVEETATTEAIVSAANDSTTNDALAKVASCDSTDTSSCTKDSSTSEEKSVTYNEDSDAMDLYVNESREVYRARKQGFYTSVQVGFRMAGGVNLLFGRGSKSWDPGYVGNFGIFTKIPFGSQYFRFVSEVDFSYRRYLHEEETEYSKNEAYVETYIFSIPLLFRYVSEDDNFFVSLGGNIDLKLSGYSEFKQDATINGKKENYKRTKSIPTNVVVGGGAFDIGYVFDGHFGFDVRAVYNFANLLDQDHMDESTLFKTRLKALYVMLGIFYQL